MKKIAFLDIDGTIRAFDGYIPPSTVEAIRGARERGHLVCISSGRPVKQIESRVMDIGFDGIIAGTGSCVIYRGETILKQFFDDELLSELLEYLEEHHCVTEFHNEGGSYLLKSQLEEYRAIGKRIQALLGLGSEPLVKVGPKIVEDMSQVGRVQKFLFFSNDLTVQDVADRWGDITTVVNCSVPHAERCCAEVSPKNANKAYGMDAILKAAGLTRADAIAIGDSENDIDMIRAAAVGIAMGNGTEPAKAAADWIAEPIMEDGLYKAFVKCGLLD